MGAAGTRSLAASPGPQRGWSGHSVDADHSVREPESPGVAMWAEDHRSPTTCDTAPGTPSTHLIVRDWLPCAHGTCRGA